MVMLPAMMRLTRRMTQQAQDDDARDQQQDYDLLRGGHGRGAVVAMVSHMIGQKVCGDQQSSSS